MTLQDRLRAMRDVIGGRAKKMRTVDPARRTYREIAATAAVAADHIDRQAARIAELETALCQIAGIVPWPDDPDGEGFGYVDLARAALKED